MSISKLKAMTIASAFSVMSFSLSSQSSFAQNAIAPDATLPVNTLVNFNNANKTYTITGGTQVGENQFHSFRDFSVPTGNTAYFDNALTTSNAIARVTGANVSNIDGILKTNGTTNLYLINPNGIVFGANAKLDIAGSFSASTANSIKFSDGSEFSATNPQAPPLLNVNVPLGLQYGKSNTGVTINNRGNLSSGQDLVLNADKLDLQGSLQAGRDLTLQAQDAITVSDTITNPFIAESGRNLVFQGNNLVNISTANNPNSMIVSGGNMVLRSDNPIVGDFPIFYAGGNFNIEKTVLDGFVTNSLESFNSAIVLAGGDVSFLNYTGSSLHILAGRSVMFNNAEIISNGTQGRTIAPNHPTQFLANLATFNLTDYQATLNGDGSVKEILPVTIPITIDGSERATLDVRSGVNWLKLGGLPVSTTFLGTDIPLSDSDLTMKADISFLGKISLSQPSGIVLLTNQFTPNDLQGAIIAQRIDTHTQATDANGGDIRIYGRSDTIIPNTELFSASVSSGNGGRIAISSTSGNIILSNTYLNTDSSSSKFGLFGNAGEVTISTNLGNIMIDALVLIASSVSTANLSGDGGNLSITSNSGNITLSNSNFSTQSDLVSVSGRSGNGGMIGIKSNSGDINIDSSILTSSAVAQAFSSDSSSGNAGTIAIASNSGNINISNFSSFSSSSYTDSGKSGNGGTLSITTNTGNINIVSSLLNSFSFASTGDSGNAGIISLSSVIGDINSSDTSFSSSSYSRFGNSGNGEAISLSSLLGNIILYNSTPETSFSSYSYSEFANAGNGGAIFLSAPSGRISGSTNSDNPKISLSSFAVSQGIGSTSGTGGNIDLEAKTQISNLEILTQSSASQSGSVKIIGFGDLAIASLQISTSKVVNIANPFNPLDVIPFEIGKTGRSGDVTINGIGNITLDSVSINTATQGIAPAGDIMIISPSAITFQNSQIFSNTNSIGNAGVITVTAGTGLMIQNNSKITAITSALIPKAGNAGDINFTSPIVKITDGSLIFAGTNGAGVGGNITINAPTSVSLTREQNVFPPILSVQTNSAGKAGNIVINTPIITLSDEARISATTTATSTNKDGGGSITLNASTMNLFGTVGVFAETQGIAPAGTLFLNPYSNDSSLNIALAPNSQISASTSGSGNGGSILVAAPETIAIAGQGKLAVETSSFGNAGNIRFTTGNLTISDGVLISASTSGAGKAGDISIRVNNLTLSNGASIQTTTSGTGDSGKIEAISSNSFVIMGTNTGLFANTETDSTGKGGNIFIDPPLVSITNGAAISVNNLGKGNGGNIDIFAGKFVFANNAFLLANTASGEGGNINLQIADIFFPRNNSNITATAGGTGNGGNINLSSLFTIAIPSENSDIFANASFGKGGNINLTTQAIFGLQFRPILTPLSDITASSEFGVQGNVNINTPGIDPSKGLSNLPANISDASKLVTQRCLADRQDSAFVISGRGGIPISPANIISSINLQENIGTPSSNQLANQSSQLISQSSNPQTNPDRPDHRIIEAQGWTIKPNGQISLVAEVTNAIPLPTWARQLQCH